MRPIVVWLRNDLRTRDHQPLLEAARSSFPVLPVYCFDPRHFHIGEAGVPRTGSFRAKFLVESVRDLRESLRAGGSDLVVRLGRPEEELAAIVHQTRARSVFFHAEVTPEETAVESALAMRLQDSGIEMRSFHGATLFDPRDLPFEIERLPEVFTRFRQQVERASAPRPALAAPERLPRVEGVCPGSIPSCETLGVPEPAIDPRSVLAFRGGETAGLARMSEYFWERDGLRRYKETRNGMLGPDYSSKLSPWLAAGCLSPRTVAEEVRRYEEQRVRNASTYWMIFELLWRDYFRFICVKHGRQVFCPSGIRKRRLPWSRDPEKFRCWCDGKTGYPLIDANMRELSATGFMSNRGRQNVASFLTKNLGVDWRLGAAWFESQLIDYDVCSNWGNWNYIAGLGNDARGFRYFNTLKQARDYDGQGRYVKHWLPELAKVPGSRVHEPWKLGVEERRRIGLEIGRHYPPPVVDFWETIQASERAYQDAVRT